MQDMGKNLTSGGVFGDSFESGFYQQELFFSEIAKSIGEQGKRIGIARLDLQTLC